MTSEMASSEVNKLEKASGLKEQVYEVLKNAIMKRECTPNERMDANTIAIKLNVSRTPVRDALNMLDHEGFVYTIARKGTYVKGIQRDDLIQIFQVREMIELYALDIGTERLFKSMEPMIEAVREWDNLSIHQNNGIMLMSSDAKFHKHIVQVTENPLIIKAYDDLNCHVQMARAYYVQDETRMRAAHQEHTDILNAAMDQNHDKIKTALKLHLDNTLVNLLKIIEVSKIL